jgi:anti-sigma factor RsiW
MLDGALKPALQAVVEQHLAACADCRLELERARAAWAGLGALGGAPEVDTDAAWAAFGQRLRAGEERAASRRWAWWLLPVPLALAGGAAVALVVSLSPGQVGPASADEMEVARHMEMLKHLDCFREYDSLEAAGLLEDPAALEAALEEVGG